MKPRSVLFSSLTDTASTASTGIRFFDHMLELFTPHGGFDLELRAQGDLDVDQHHTVEDVGIVLGEAFHKARLERGSYGRDTSSCPWMKLGPAAVDFGGRASAVADTKVRQRLVGDGKPNSSMISLTALPGSARQCPCSRALWQFQPPQGRGLFKAFSRRCALPAGATAAWPACRPAPRAL